jgi:hypothetical protein
VLLDDRGWSEELRVLGADASSSQERRQVEQPGIWAYETVGELERTARAVVGPDEPFGGRTAAELEATHWESLARVLQREGVEVEAAELKRLPHDVELGERVLARIGGGRHGL